MATVVLPGGPAGEFDYLVPAELVAARGRSSGSSRAGGCGCRWAAAIAASSAIAWRVGNKPAGGRKLKRSPRCSIAQPLLSPAMLRLTRWMADYYLCPWGQVLEAVVPAGVRRQAGTRDVTLLSVPPEVAARLGELEAAGQAGRSAASCWRRVRGRFRRSNLRRAPAARSRRSTSCGRRG